MVVAISYKGGGSLGKGAEASQGSAHLGAGQVTLHLPFDRQDDEI